MNGSLQKLVGRVGDYVLPVVGGFAFGPLFISLASIEFMSSTLDMKSTCQELDAIIPFHPSYSVSYVRWL